MLRRKMLREMLGNKLAFFACALVIMLGLVGYTAMSMSKDNLLGARETFYAKYHFADGFAKVKAMPLSKIRELRSIEGIEDVQGRLVKDVRVYAPEKRKNIYLRLVSLDLNESRRLNDIQLLKGAFPSEKDRAILLSDNFLKANQLELGQSITLIIGGREVEVVISGTGQSPEFVYLTRTAQDIAPDPESFEVAYMPFQQMEKLFSQPGIVNDITFTLKEGFVFKDVEQAVKHALEGYHLEMLVGRKDQVSHAFLEEELKSLEKTSTSIPLVFLGIAALILYIMLKRMVESQRVQIGMLSSFGYRKKEILFHYLSYGLAIGLAGGAIGGLLGTALSFSMTKMYRQYYSLPNLTGHFSIQYFAYGIVLAVAFSVLAAYQGAKGVLKLEPAEAMRPPVPVFQRNIWLERLTSFWRLFTMQGRMALRNVFRNRGRSLFTFIGIVFTFSLMASVWSINSMVDALLVDQFAKVQKHDVKMSFEAPIDRSRTLRELQARQGVKRVEPMLEVPAALQFGHRRKETSIMGLISGSELYHLLDKNGHEVNIPKDGVILSELIAEKLQVKTGDSIRFESPLAKDSELEVTVAGTVPQMLGASVYMNQDALLRLLRQGDFATSMLISIDPSSIPELTETYRTSPLVNSIEDRQQVIGKFKELMGTTTNMIWVMALLSVIIGFAIVYNSSIISFSERSKELASLRVLGLHPKEVMEVISVEQWFIGFMGIVAGVPMAYLMNYGFSKSMSSDLYTIPGTTDLASLAAACLGTALAIWTAQWWVGRKVTHLDLVEVLKARE